MNVTMLDYPSYAEWMEVKRRALVTVGKQAVTAPSMEWKRKMLEARHSPIRYLRFSFLVEDLPYWVHVELVRHHVGIQFYVKSQRNDRQSDYDRNAARQDAPVDLIVDMNAEALMTLANKRLCMKATPEARAVVQKMCELVEDQCPEFKGFLVPACLWHGGACHEMETCGRWGSK